MVGGGERKTLAYLGNHQSFSVAGLWRERKWVERNKARGIKQSYLINYAKEFAQQQTNCFKMESVLIKLEKSLRLYCGAWEEEEEWRG